MSRFTWAKEEERFKHRVQDAVETSLKIGCVAEIGPGTRGRAVADRVAQMLWTDERYRIERERLEARERKASR